MAELDLDDAGTAEADLARAHVAFAQGDLPHALHHVGCALAHDPMDQERLALLGQIVAASPEPLGLVELGSDASFVDVANRAYVLAWLRRWPEALDLITDVAEVRPDLPYLLWCEWWIAAPGVMQSVPVADLVSKIVVDLLQLASRCPIPTPATDPRWATLESSSRILAAFRALHPNQSILWFGSSLVARRLGERAEALTSAQRAYQLEPSWKGAVAVANALRDDARLDDAAQWYRRALGHDRSDTTAHLDLGDMFLDAGRLDEATREYESALSKETDQPWATASLLYLRFRHTGDAKLRQALLRLAEDDPPNDRAQALLDRIDPPRRYLNRLPHPADASANALRDVFAQMATNPAAHHGGTVHLTLSHVESPSVVAAFWLQLEMWGPQVALDYQVERIQTPDPRQPKAQVPFAVWRWDGTQPVPAIARPPAHISHELRALAAEPFALDTWAPRAADAAVALGGARALPGLLGTLVFPPRPPDSTWRILPWVQRSQIATALVLAHIEPQTPWTGSSRQQALYGLLYGPTDWTTTAAIIALGVIARADPTIRAEVVQAFTWLQSQRPLEGYCCWELPLVATWKTFPDLDAPTLQRLTALERRILDHQTPSTSVRLCQLDAPRFDLAAELTAAQTAAQTLAAPTAAPTTTSTPSDADPLVFPGQPIAHLSDYVNLMQAMQGGNMLGALGQYGLDLTAYAAVATAWGQRLAADPILNGKFVQMMAR